MDNLISKYSVGDRVQGKSILTNMSIQTQNIVKGHHDRGFIVMAVKWDDNSQTEVKEKYFWSDSSAVANSTSNYFENVLSSAGNVESDSDSEDSNDDLMIMMLIMIAKVTQMRRRHQQMLILLGPY